MSIGFQHVWKKCQKSRSPMKKLFSKKKAKEIKVHVVEDLVCYCYRVKKQEIQLIIKKYNCRTVEAVKLHCSACQGCGGCWPDIEDLISENTAEE